MKGATPVPGPTMIMGNAGSEGRRKETFDRRLTKIWEGGEGGGGHETSQCRTEWVGAPYVLLTRIQRMQS